MGRPIVFLPSPASRASVDPPAVSEIRESAISAAVSSPGRFPGKRAALSSLAAETKGKSGVPSRPGIRLESHCGKAGRRPSGTWLVGQNPAALRPASIGIRVLSHPRQIKNFSADGLLPMAGSPPSWGWSLTARPPPSLRRRSRKCRTGLVFGLLKPPLPGSSSNQISGCAFAPGGDQTSTCPPRLFPTLTSIPSVAV